MRSLPNDRVLLVFDFLQCPQPLAAVARRYADAWRACYRRYPGGGTGPGADDAPPLWVRVRMDRCGGWLAPATSAPRTLFMDVVHWGGERLYPGRLLASTAHSLTRLALHSLERTFVQESMWHALCSALPARLRVVEVGVRQGRLSDGAFVALGAVLGTRLPELAHVRVAVPMNNITLAGLRGFVNGLQGAVGLRELELDVSGNLIRGVEYGGEVARLGRLPRLTALSVTFGGWAMRKQFGLQALADLQHASGLRRLALTIVGARITCDFFKKAIAGIVLLPRLEALTLDVARSDVGEQCQRALGQLRGSPTLRRLTLALGAPSERLLLALGVLRHAPRIEALDLSIDHRMHPLSPEHLCALEFLADIPEVVLDHGAPHRNGWAWGTVCGSISRARLPLGLGFDRLLRTLRRCKRIQLDIQDVSRV